MIILMQFVSSLPILKQNFLNQNLWNFFIKIKSISITNNRNQYNQIESKISNEEFIYADRKLKYLDHWNDIFTTCYT